MNLDHSFLASPPPRERAPEAVHHGRVSRSWPGLTSWSWGSGFTLLELLVTLTLVAVLIGLLVPTYSTFMSKTADARCASNLRSLYMAASAYRVDGGSFLSMGRNSETDPSAYGSQIWFISLLRMKYISAEIRQINDQNVLYADVLFCPANKVVSEDPFVWTWTRAPYPLRGSYAMGSLWGDAGGKPEEIPGRHPRIPALAVTNSRAIMFIDTELGNAAIFPGTQTQWTSNGGIIPLNLHKAGAHAILADGSLDIVNPETYPDIENTIHWDPRL